MKGKETGEETGSVFQREGGWVLVDLSLLFGLLCYSRRLVNIFFSFIWSE